MAKNDRHIEIVRSTIKELSSMSKESSEAIFAALSRSFEDVLVTVVNDLSDLEALVARRPDLVFLGMKFIPRNTKPDLADNKIWLSDYLDDQGIAYTGSGQTAHELEFNKPLAKQIILDAGLSTSSFFVINQGQSPGTEDISLTFPLFVKPTNRGGGSGIDSDSVVHDFEQLRSKARSIANELQANSLVEEYLPGREFSVAILKEDNSSGFLAMPIELVAPAGKDGARLLSSKVKSSNTEQALRIADETVRSSVAALALDVFRALGGRDYGRIDIRLDAAGEPHFLEANLIPSLISGYGSFPKACMLNMGLEYEQMIMRITELGLARATKSAGDILEPIEMNGRGLMPAEAALELA